MHMILNFSRQLLISGRLFKSTLKAINRSPEFNTLPHNLKFQGPCTKMLLKALWEKEKNLVTSIFSSSHNVFYRIKDSNHHFSNAEFVVCK